MSEMSWPAAWRGMVESWARWASHGRDGRVMGEMGESWAGRCPRLSWPDGIDRRVCGGTRSCTKLGVEGEGEGLGSTLNRLHHTAGRQPYDTRIEPPFAPTSLPCHTPPPFRRARRTIDHRPSRPPHLITMWHHGSKQLAHTHHSPHLFPTRVSTQQASKLKGGVQQVRT